MSLLISLLLPSGGIGQSGKSHFLLKKAIAVGLARFFETRSGFFLIGVIEVDGSVRLATEIREAGHLRCLSSLDWVTVTRVQSIFNQAVVEARV